MQVTPTGQSEFHNGNEVGRYARDISNGIYAFCWYHEGICGDPTWAMDKDVEFKISVSVDVIIVADSINGAFAIDRSEFTNHVEIIGGTEEYVARAEMGHVEYLGEPKQHLKGFLWIESGNEVNENYHQKKNEA